MQLFPNNALSSKLRCSEVFPGTNMARVLVMCSEAYGGLFLRLRSFINGNNEWRSDSSKGPKRRHQKSATVKDVTQSTLTQRWSVVLGATVDQVASKLIHMRDNHDYAPPPNPPIVVPEMLSAGSGGKRRRAPVYKKKTKQINYSSSKRAIIYNF